MSPIILVIFLMSSVLASDPEQIEAIDIQIWLDILKRTKELIENYDAFSDEVSNSLKTLKPNSMIAIREWLDGYSSIVGLRDDIQNQAPEAKLTGCSSQLNAKIAELVPEIYNSKEQTKNPNSYLEPSSYYAPLKKYKSTLIGYIYSCSQEPTPMCNEPDVEEAKINDEYQHLADRQASFDDMSGSFLEVSAEEEEQFKNDIDNKIVKPVTNCFEQCKEVYSETSDCT